VTYSIETNLKMQAYINGSLVAASDDKRYSELFEFKVNGDELLDFELYLQLD